jgi:type I restriction enzyme S subunit
MSPSDNPWRRFRFAEIAESITERVDDPSTAGVDRYVGLEHLDPGSLFISRWGSPTDVEATKLRFDVGDIIFGRRRAYQRKVAVADFRGICSAHALVLRARPTVAAPEFLPFFVQSDVFFDRALAISVGSLSPTINWETLARQEFELPPLDEQQRMAALLWALEQARRAGNALSSSLIELIRSSIADFVVNASRRPEWPSVSCLDLLKEGPRNGYSATPNDQQRGYPTLSIAAVRDGELEIGGNLKYADIPPAIAEGFLLTQGDVLVVRGNGNRDLVGRCALVNTAPPNCIYPDLLIRLRFDPAKMRADFAALLWNSDPIHTALLRRAKSTNGIWKVNGRDVSTLELLAPPLDEQAQIVADVMRLRSSLFSVKSQASVTLSPCAPTP